MFEECKLEGVFELSSGKKSNVFYDFDLLTPPQLLEYANKLCNKIEGLDFDFVVAPALGGILPGWIVAGEFGKRLVIANKDGEFRGLDKVTEEGATKFLLVDDVISTYGTVSNILGNLPEFSCVAVAAFIFRGDDIKPNTYVLEHKEVEK